MVDKMKILIVDDDINICETLKDILEEKGHVVIVANDGETAVSIAKKDPQDIIFLDMRLPTMNGFETYIATRKFDSKVVVVLMTAYQSELKSCIEKALAKNAYTCIYKPFDPELIFDIVEKIKHKKRTIIMVKKILIVDDDMNARTVLHDLLTERGYKVIEATNKKNALEKVRTEKPDVTLLDTKLGEDMEGDEICRQIKKVEGLDTKVIVYTGNIDVVDVKKAMDVGADDYVMKTSDFSLLLEAIEKLI